VVEEPIALPSQGISASSFLDCFDGQLPEPVAAPTLVMLVGLPGSGKSTLARRLAPAIGAVVLESDALRRRFFTRPVHSPEESRVLFAAINAAMAQLLRGGVPIILDATNLKESDRRPVEAIAHAMGARLIVVYVKAPAAVIEERLRRRELAPGRYAEAGIDVYRRMARSMQPPASSEAWQIDTADRVFYEAAVEKIIQEAINEVPRGRFQSKFACPERW
jgi:predicted kinase